MIEHLTVEANGAAFHVARTGEGPPLVLLHGWPEFWLTWEPVMQRLSDRFTLYAPDLRGFGDSAKPEGDYGNEAHADDMLALIATLGLDKPGIVAHDVGGAVLLAMARKDPERFRGLFFFDFVYPGIGARFGAPEQIKEIWYQSFHLLDTAPVLVGATLESNMAYIAHFLRHWAHRKAAFSPVMREFIQNFMKPGNISGGFAYYRGVQEMRLKLLKGELPADPQVHVPTCVRWAEHDPLFPYEWTDRLGQTFTNLDLAMFPDVGHFPHREDPIAPRRRSRGFSGGWADREFPVRRTNTALAPSKNR